MLKIIFIEIGSYKDYIGLIKPTSHKVLVNNWMKYEQENIIVGLISKE